MFTGVPSTVTAKPVPWSRSKPRRKYWLALPMLEFEGRSYRMKEAAARIAITPESSRPDRPAWGSWPDHK
jgi:hypothetical protein